MNKEITITIMSDNKVDIKTNFNTNPLEMIGILYTVLLSIGNDKIVIKK
jgi:hypothetical protein